MPCNRLDPWGSPGNPAGDVCQDICTDLCSLYDGRCVGSEYNPTDGTCRLACLVVEGLSARPTSFTVPASGDRFLLDVAPDRVRARRHRNDGDESGPTLTYYYPEDPPAAPPVPANQPPVADAGGPYAARAREPIAFSAALSTDPDGRVARHAWDFGDGTRAEGPAPTHVFDQAGTYQVGLTVWDGLDLSHSMTVGVSVAAALPIESVTWSSMVGVETAGGVVTKSAPTARWDAGAVSSRAIVTGDGYVEFMASEAGTDRMLGLGPGDMGNGHAGLDFAFHLAAGGRLDIYEGGTSRGTASTYVPGDILRISVTAGSARYSKNGVELARSPHPVAYPLRAVAALWSPGSTLRDAVIAGDFPSNRAPVARAGGPYAGQVGEPIALDASGTIDPDGGVLGYWWTFGDGSSSGSLSPTHAYSLPGTYTARLKVTDEHGQTGIATAVVVVEHPFTVERVSWKALAGVVTTGRGLLKSAEGDDWNAGARSTRSIASGAGYAEFTASESGTDRMLGLNHGSSNPGSTDLDYGLVLSAQGSVAISESGVTQGLFGSYQAGDRFRLSTDGGVVRYWKNGALLRQSGTAAQYPLRVYASLRTAGATIEEVVIAGSFPPNHSPIASAGGPYVVRAGEPLHLDGSASRDPDGVVQDYRWQFGDGELGTGPTPMHTYALPGDYTIALTVTDDTGAEASLTATANATRPFVHNALVWTNGQGVSISGSGLTKTGGSGAWSAGALSLKSIPEGDGYVEFVASETTTHRVLGLNHANAGYGYADIDFAFQLSAVLGIIENGVHRGLFARYASGDRLRISLDSGVVRYSKNGHELYRSAAAVAYPLNVDASLWTPGATLGEVVIAQTAHATAYQTGSWSVCSGSGGFTCTASGPTGCRRPGTQSRPVTETAWSFDPASAVPPPPVTQSCTETVTGYVSGYVVGDWSPCNAECGTGFKFRTVSPSAWSPVGPDATAPIDNAACNQQACPLTCGDYEMYDSQSACHGDGWPVCEVRYRDDAVGGILTCWKGFE